MPPLSSLPACSRGAFRWTLFFPYVGTRAYDIAKEAGAIDFAKMAFLDNFTDETCMDLGADVNLYVRKVKDFFCAFVNGYAGLPEYERIVSEIEAYDEAAWPTAVPLVAKKIEDADRRMRERRAVHYSRVRYNRFMGVRKVIKDDSILPNWAGRHGHGHAFPACPEAVGRRAGVGSGQAFGALTFTMGSISYHRFISYEGNGLVRFFDIVNAMRGRAFRTRHSPAHSFRSSDLLFFLGSVGQRVGYNRNGRGFMLHRTVAEGKGGGTGAYGRALPAHPR